MLKGQSRHNSLKVDRTVPTDLNKPARVMIVCFVLLLPFVAITCSTKGADKLYGRWGNEQGRRMTFNSNGTGSYNNNDGSIAAECRFVVEKEWTDGKGNTWYHIKQKSHLPPYQEAGAVTNYLLTMIDSTGTRMEWEQTQSDYPTELHGEAGTGHWLFMRVK